MLLLLPGLDGTGRLFTPLLDALAEVGAPDAAAVAYPTDRPLSYDDLVQYVIDTAPPPPWVVLGESFSGPVAIQLTARHPDAVTGVILCATFTGSPVPRALPRVASYLPQPAPPSALVRALLTGSDAPRDLVHDVRRAIAAVRGDVLRARFHALATVDVAEELARVQAPILCLEAAHDRLVGRRSAERITQAAPHAERVRIASPHLLAQRHPHEVARAITRWLGPGPQRSP